MQMPTVVEGKDIIVVGRYIKTARLLDENYVAVENPQAFVGELRSAGVRADLFTFVQDIHDRVPKYDFHSETEDMAVLPVSTYKNWLNNQITTKPRNKLRKALKSGMEVRVIAFSDDLVRGIMAVYNENPIRQGMRNLHYGKDFDTIKREHNGFLERSDFIGVFYQDEMIGFAKVVHSEGCSHLMKIVSMISHRDKAPTNALLAKAVEVCAARGSPYLGYSVWGKRPGLNEFKEANGFERVEIPRYFMPLNQKGKMILRLALHRPLKDRLPDKWVVLAGEFRSRCNALIHRKHSAPASAD
jgi:hypothetical protein